MDFSVTWSLYILYLICVVCRWCGPGQGVKSSTRSSSTRFVFMSIGVDYCRRLIDIWGSECMMMTWTSIVPSTVSPKSHLWPWPTQWPQSVSSSWPPWDGVRCLVINALWRRLGGQQGQLKQIADDLTFGTAFLKPNGLKINYMTCIAGPLRTEEPGERSKVVGPINTITSILMATSSHWRSTEAFASSLHLSGSCQTWFERRAWRSWTQRATWTTRSYPCTWSAWIPWAARPRGTEGARDCVRNDHH